MSSLFLSDMRYQLSFISIYGCKQTNNIRPTYCTLCECWNPLQQFTVHLYAAGFNLNGRCKLAVTQSILTCSLLYNLQHFPLLFVIIFLLFRQLQAMCQETLQTGAIGAKSSWTTGASSNAPPSETQQQRRHHLVHHDTAIVATENMNQEGHLKMVPKTGSSDIKKQHTLGCESFHISLDDSHLTI